VGGGEGGSAGVAGRWEGGGCGGVDEGWVVMESSHNNGGAPSSCGRFGDFLLFFMQLRVDDF
jgi:hypothetical protein